MTYEHVTKVVEGTVCRLDDRRPLRPVSVVSSAARKQQAAARPDKAVHNATLVIATPLATSHERCIAALQQAFEVCQVIDYRGLEQVLVKLRPDILVVDLALPGLRRVRGLRAVQTLSPATKIVALTDAPSDDEGIMALKAGVQGYCASTIEPDALTRAVTAVRKGELWAPRKLVAALIREFVSRAHGRDGLDSGVDSRDERVPGVDSRDEHRFAFDSPHDLGAAIDSRDEHGFAFDSRAGDELPPTAGRRIGGLTRRQSLVADLISSGASNKEISNRLNITERTVKAHLTEAFRNAGVSDRLQLALLWQGSRRAAGKQL